MNKEEEEEEDKEVEEEGKDEEEEEVEEEEEEEEGIKTTMQASTALQQSCTRGKGNCFFLSSQHGGEGKG